ncbi:glucose 1-dehydrogenase [Bdellovibrio bacteriovorus]|uniref:2,5-dichloro-2,5-cyclohexadiene-1,4-diol dehydrogenase n=1 Tax=Bdellovibrio bacteriovorus str. Tiberius TaxID=1069642 RepID=K7ZES0_BDEBC|nr:glucose 1-dehydrogenase [Bdellovibrio bacteriovorus]AFY00777.1 2,5-dichloro-2,5-cyclohexadiene-1,4-diol dehydrogenase [Bdellovibrio bacteriovorus str. Tiberius]
MLFKFKKSPSLAYATFGYYRQRLKYNPHPLEETVNTGKAYDFNGKVAVVTGGASGMGRASCLAFAQSGAKVAIIDEHKENGLETVRLIESKGGKAIFYECDVSKGDVVKKAFEQIWQDFGRLDYAYNNAGIEGDEGSTDVCTEENFKRLIDVHLFGVWVCMKYEIPLMLKSGGGSIVNCSSAVGLVGMPGNPGYVAAKHGIIGATKAAALEFATAGIRVNAICPGVIKTPMFERIRTQKGQIIPFELFLRNEPIGRFGEPEEIGSAVMWLCSNESAFVTGHALSVDGGWVTQ